jgi:replication-associated recombination protein RarA
MAQTQSLTAKYRPDRIEDLVLPRRHQLHKALAFLQSPYPSAWMLAGPPGLGKTSLALLMARAASENPYSRMTYVGPDLDSNRIRELALTLKQRPVWGGYHALVINEADSVPRLAQVRLLEMVEDMANAVVIATANSDLDSFESRLTSRFYLQQFTKEGLLQPGADWLEGIAALEGIRVTRNALERMVVDSKSNLRAALQSLDTYAARPHPAPAPLPVRTGVELPMNRGRTVIEPAR